MAGATGNTAMLTLKCKQLFGLTGQARRPAMEEDKDEDTEHYRYLEHQLLSLCDDEDDEDQEENDEKIVKECTEIQKQELELLKAVFFGPGELTVDEDEDEAYGANSVPRSVSICPAGSPGLELHVTLPVRYPVASVPQLMVRVAHLDRAAHRQLQRDVQEFLRAQPEGEPLLLAIVDWLQMQDLRKIPAQADRKVGSSEDEEYCRIWILSHHIYSKTKRKHMLSLAQDLGLTGFLLPGKPGIVCIEGKECDCNEWWVTIRNLNWKKISEKKRDKWTGKGKTKFPPFQELVSGDFKTFRKFLETTQQFDVFIELFGFNTQ